LLLGQVKERGEAHMNSVQDIVFIHKGDAFFIEHSLRIAKTFNPKATIHLIGDSDNKKYSSLNGVKHYDISKFDSGASEFRNIYKHISANPKWVESLCFERFFILKDFYLSTNTHKCLLIDTDLFLLHNISETHANHNSDIVLIFDESTYYSIFNTKAIQGFCEFMLNFYKQSHSTIVEKIKQYGILNRYGVQMHFPDMRLLKYFVSEQKSFTITFLNQTPETKVGEYNIYFRKIFDDDDTKSKWVIEKDESFLDKEIKWDGPTPFRDGLRFKTLHFQGDAKKFINYFYDNIIKRLNPHTE